jgi:hypothetical protein
MRKRVCTEVTRKQKRAQSISKNQRAPKKIKSVIIMPPHVPIRTSKIWNEVIGASQFRSGYSRENEKRSIRRSTQAASIGVWYRAGPPFEAAQIYSHEQNLCARFDKAVNLAVFVLRQLNSSQNRKAQESLGLKSWA